MVLRTGHSDLFYIIYLQPYSNLLFLVVFFFLQAKVMINERLPVLVIFLYVYRPDHWQ